MIQHALTLIFLFLWPVGLTFVLKTSTFFVNIHIEKAAWCDCSVRFSTRILQSAANSANFIEVWKSACV